MRGASVVRRRSVPNIGETSGPAGSVNGGQADSSGSGLLAGGGPAGSGVGGAGGAAGEVPGAVPGAGRRDTDPKRATGPQVALGQAAAAQGVQGGAVTPPTGPRQVAPARTATQPGAGRPRRP